MAVAKDVADGKIAQYNFTYLLVTLVLVLAVAPLFEGRFFGQFLHLACMTAVFVASAQANYHRARVFAVGLAIAVFAIPLMWSALLLHRNDLTIAYFVFAIFLLGMTAILILIAVMKDHSASPHAITGAICAYLMLGLTWAVVYSAVEHLEVEYAEQEPFEFNHRNLAGISPDGRETSFSQWVYFSFVTMSTLGYGDITPRTALAQTATWMQSVTGVFYLAVLVSRLVNSIPQRQDS